MGKAHVRGVAGGDPGVVQVQFGLVGAGDAHQASSLSLGFIPVRYPKMGMKDKAFVTCLAPLEVQSYIGLIADNPGIMPWCYQKGITRPDLAFCAIVHHDVHAA